jgi:ribonuclease HI
VDGAYYKNNRCGATGAVLRDHHGSFVKAVSRWYPNSLDTLTMEALALQDGVALVQGVGAHNLWMETDCQELVKLWEAGDKQRSSIFAVLNEIREMSASFNDVTLVYANRKCNRVAHEHAKKASSDMVAGVWYEIPACIYHLLAEDCNHVAI